MSGAAAELRALLASGTADERLGRGCAEILRDIARGRLTPRGLRHPLGFLYVPLDRRPDSVLRLHLWPRRPWWSTLTTSPYHMHAWRLVSYVHRGAVRNTTVEVRAAADGDAEYRVFDIDGEGERDLLVPSEETVAVSSRATSTVRAGGLYGLDVGTFHCTSLLEGTAAVTLALVDRVPGARERALGPCGLGRHSTLRATAPADELRRFARESLLEPGA
ncbi:hypothetical protein Shyhy01_03900 [Streptomyces hygroscopicus subsp. hygroscopicus]|nr:hypothetical protein [Streptomyces hygroscopicus]GLX47440.1 hypothetical protein Shyhy01_03900 [Streptomyces hygroscopicus subsp. hygroscopicus]